MRIQFGEKTLPHSMDFLTVPLPEHDSRRMQLSRSGLKQTDRRVSRALLRVRCVRLPD